MITGDADLLSFINVQRTFPYVVETMHTRKERRCRNLNGRSYKSESRGVGREIFLIYKYLPNFDDSASKMH